jgi:hypothetical protein
MYSQKDPIPSQAVAILNRPWRLVDLTGTIGLRFDLTNDAGLKYS